MMRKSLIILALAVFTSIPALAYVNVSIGINVPVYPDLRRIPGYPVYYAPRLHANYFFYDGLYWVYVPDGWYVSPWYDGPWEPIAIDSVPLFVLRIPLRYYGYPPVTFRHWVMNAPPRWDAVWGEDWARRHHDWQRWNRVVPAPAPLPSYQQRYTRANYPNDAQRRELLQQHYSYTPRDAQVRQRWQTHVGEPANRPLARPSHPQQSQVQPARPQDVRANDPRLSEHEDAQAKGHAPPRRAPVAQPEPPRVQADVPHVGPMAAHRAAEDRGPARNAKPDHGGRPDKPDKGDKGDDHESNKRH